VTSPWLAHQRTKSPALQKEDRHVIKPYLIISIAAGLLSRPVLAAEPFMDGAPGYCFLCGLMTPRPSVKSQPDNCPKPDEISRSLPQERREARSDSASWTNAGGD
jgi:hypothetical protein